METKAGKVRKELDLGVFKYPPKM